MKSKIWLAASSLLGLLFSALLLLVGQRDKARREHQVATDKVDALKNQRGVDARIAEKKKKASQKTKETKEVHRERDETTRPSGSFRRD